MSDSQPTGIPEDFIEQVKQALENLYDFPALQHSPLAHVSPAGVHELRRKLTEAIESLNPGHDVASHSGAARIYNLVYLHYVGGMTLQEAALEVGLSLRQAYRDLRRGHERVSAVLWYVQSHETEQRPEPAELSSIQTEMTRLEGSVTTIPLQKMLESGIRAVQKLADQRQITLDVHMPQASVLMTTSPAIAQQVLTQLLSQIIQQVAPSSLRVSLEEPNGSVHIVFSYPLSGASKPHVEPVIEQMMRQIGWKTQSRSHNGEHQLVIRSAQEGALLLIIDDNQGLVELLDHYLTNHAYRVVSVHNGEDGLRMVQQFMPDAIILDLMMPGMDGWELLQRLRTDGDTQDIPVIICSVISDPELAYSLGASRCIPKPVTEEALLSTLRELNLGVL
jgi:CheY-like chemotaxis protein